MMRHELNIICKGVCKLKHNESWKCHTAVLIHAEVSRAAIMILCTLAIVISCGNTLIAQNTDGSNANPIQVSSETQSESQDDTQTQSQIIVADPRPQFESPQATLQTYMNAMAKYSEEPDNAALDDAIACFDLPEESELQRSPQELAKELLGVLNRIGEIENGHLPTKWLVNRYDLKSYALYPRNTKYSYPKSVSDPFESSNGDIYFKPFEIAYGAGRIEFIKSTNDEWLISSNTIRNIHEFYTAVFDLPIRFGIDERDLSLALRLRGMLPASFQSGDLLGVEYWQWTALLLLIFAGVLLDYFIRAILNSVIIRILTHRGLTADDSLIRRVLRPLGLLAAGVLWINIFPSFAVPPWVLTVLLIATRLIIMVASVWAAYRITDLAGDILSGKAESTETKFDDLLIPLIRKTIKVFITAFGLIYIADSLQIEILPLLTGLGIGGAAIAFASKDTVENFFGSVAVIVDRPFEVGDWIVVGNSEGTVEAVGFRSTRIRTFYNSLITVPNSNLVRATVDNYGKRKYRRYKTTLSITYSTPPDRIEAFCEGIRELIRNHPYTRKDYFHVWLNNYAASSLDILLYMFFETPEWSTELRERHRFMLDIQRLAVRLGVDFAYPTQTLYIERGNGHFDPQQNLPPTAQNTEKNAINLGKTTASNLISEAPWKHGQIPSPVTFGAVSLSFDEDDDDSQIEATKDGN